MPLLIITLLVVALLIGFRKKIARLLERTEGPIARRGNNRQSEEINQIYQAPYYNSIQIAQNQNYQNPSYPTTYNYPPQQYPNAQYNQNEVLQSNYSQLSLNDANNARRDARSHNPYQMNMSKNQTSSSIGVNPYIRSFF